MTYRPTRRLARLRDRRRLDAAMVVADKSGADVARAGSISRQYVSMLRLGTSTTLAVEHAEAIEAFLDCPRGRLFDYGDEPEPVAADRAGVAS